MTPAPTRLFIRRHAGEAIVIDGPARIQVLRVDRDHTVLLAVEAAPSVRILREELVEHEVRAALLPIDDREAQL